jgi:hypothetical protein
MSNEHDGIHEAVEHFFRDGIGLAIRVAAEHQQLREKRLMLAREDGRQSVTDELHRQGLDRALNATRWQLVQQPDWWDKMPASEILRTYESARSFGDEDPNAAATVHAMNHEVKERYGVDPEDLDTADVPREEIEAHWAKYLAKRQEAERETTPAHALDATPAAAGTRHHEALKQVQTVAEVAGVDEKAVEILAGMHQLGMAKALAEVSHAHTVEEGTRIAASGTGKTSARKHVQGLEPAPQRELGR